jgi:uncharacterized protein (TIGR03435 family)
MKWTVFAIAISGLCSFAQPERPAFEVASIKLVPENRPGYTAYPTYGTGRFTTTKISLGLLVQLAYGVQEDQIVGIDKLGSAYFDVFAKAEDGVKLTYAEVKPRLQRLLEERFRLVVHNETKDATGYELVVAKGGPKLKAAAADAPLGKGMITQTGIRNPSGAMAMLAGMLQIATHRPVADKTGIAGNFDIKLDYNAGDKPDSQLPSVFAALQEQLGLKLETHKTSAPVLVIDSCEKSPAEN